MWKATTGVGEGPVLQQEAAGLQPTTAELLRQALDPPREKPSLRQPPNDLLRIQLAICAGLLLLLLAARQFGWPAYAQCRAYLLQALEQGIDLSEEAELVRFASRFVEDVRIRASSWAGGPAGAGEPEAGSDETQPLVSLSAASSGTSEKKAPPEGYSLKSYIPLQELSLPLADFTVTSGYGWQPSHHRTVGFSYRGGHGGSRGQPYCPCTAGDRVKYRAQPLIRQLYPAFAC